VREAIVRSKAKSAPTEYRPQWPDNLPDRMLTTQQAAAYCGYSVSHWRQMFKTRSG